MGDAFPYGLSGDEVEEFRELFDLIATDEHVRGGWLG